jgi:hypothetical protein
VVAKPPGRGAGLQTEPLKWRTVPLNPTAKMSLEVVPQIQLRYCVEPLAIGAQEVPLEECRIAPSPPAAYRSSGALAQALVSRTPLEILVRVQSAPLLAVNQITPSGPTAYRVAPTA